MYLFFDTETTGLPINYLAPAEELNNWPRLVQLSWILTEGNGREIMIKNRIIKPEGFIIPKEASNIHGIDDETALKKGVKLKKVIEEFCSALDNSEMIVAHNIKFDEKIVSAEMIRLNISLNCIDDKIKLCTMKNSTDFCRIKNGFGYKWPKLEELHQKLFSKGFSNAHDAFFDVKACAKCFFELKKRGIIN